MTRFRDNLHTLNNDETAADDVLHILAPTRISLHRLGYFAPNKLSLHQLNYPCSNQAIRAPTKLSMQQPGYSCTNYAIHTTLAPTKLSPTRLFLHQLNYPCTNQATLAPALVLRIWRVPHQRFKIMFCPGVRKFNIVLFLLWLLWKPDTWQHSLWIISENTI